MLESKHYLNRNVSAKSKPDIEPFPKISNECESKLLYTTHFLSEIETKIYTQNKKATQCRSKLLCIK